MFSNQNKIMFEELPNVDRLWYLINSIIASRETNDFKLENILYEKLVYLHRDPLLLIYITREKEKNEWVEISKLDIFIL